MKKLGKESECSSHGRKKSKVRFGRLLPLLPPKVRIGIRFFRSCGYIPNIRKPKTFNEKIQARKLKWKNPLFVVCSDKFRVRQYVAERVGEQYLIPLLYKGEEISPKVISNLVQQYGKIVMKPNNGSHCIHFIDDTTSEKEFDRMIAEVKSHAVRVSGIRKDESWYQKISPMILVEAFLGQKGDTAPIDYKFHVFSRQKGQKTVILGVDFDRFTNHNRTFYDESMKLLDISDGVLPNYYREIKKPRNFEVMIEIAKELAEEFSYVRIDLYNLNGELRFGEMTFAHHSGFRPFAKVEDDFRLGKLWENDYRY